MANKPIRNMALDIIDAIDNAPLSRKKIHELLPGIYFNRNKVHPIFKKITGLTFTQYRRKKRIEEAAELLISEDELDIQQVVYKCGHRGKSAQSNFSRDFKEVTGMTPSEWVSQNRPDDEPENGLPYNGDHNVQK